MLSFDWIKKYASSQQLLEMCAPVVVVFGGQQQGRDRERERQKKAEEERLLRLSFSLSVSRGLSESLEEKKKRAVFFVR